MQILTVLCLGLVLSRSLSEAELGVIGDISDETFEMLISGGYKPKSNRLSRHVVSIRTHNYVRHRGDNHFCSGVLVSSRAVLTAAHCLTEWVCLSWGNSFFNEVILPQSVQGLDESTGHSGGFRTYNSTGGLWGCRHKIRRSSGGPSGVRALQEERPGRPQTSRTHPELQPRRTAAALAQNGQCDLWRHMCDPWLGPDISGELFLRPEAVILWSLSAATRTVGNK